MSTQRYVSTSFWDDSFVQDLTPQEKLLFLYLLTNPLTNVAGIYKITIRRMVFDTLIDRNEVQAILKKFSDAKKAYLVGEYVVIPSWPKHQQYEIRPNIRKGIERVLDELPKDVLETVAGLDYGFPIDLPKPSCDPDTTLKDLQGPSHDPPMTLNEDQGSSGEGSNYLDLDLDSDLDLDLVNTSPSESGKPPPQKLSALKNPKANAWQATLIEEQHWDNIPAERRACGTLADRGDLLLADLPPPAQTDLAQLGDGDVHTGIARVALDVLHSQKAAEKQKAGSNPFWVGTPETPMGILGKWKWLKQLIIDKTKSSKSEYDRLIEEVLGS